MMQRISVPYLKICDTKYAIGGQTLKNVYSVNGKFEHHVLLMTRIFLKLHIKHYAFLAEALEKL